MEINFEKSRVFDKESLFMRTEVGEASGHGSLFDMSLVNGHIPSVKCSNTGKTFVLAWEDILTIAVAHGISEPDE